MGRFEDLYVSCSKGDERRVRELLNEKTTRLQPMLLFRSLASELRRSHDPSSGYTCAHIAALHGHTAVLRVLCCAHCQLVHCTDKRGCLPLHLAVWNGKAQTVEYLLSLDEDLETSQVNQKNADACLRNARGETPLDVAARFGRTNCVRLLLDHAPALVLHAAVEAYHSGNHLDNNCSRERERCSSRASSSSSNNNTHPFALHLAARNGHTATCKVLLAAGFDVDSVTVEGTALHVAAVHARISVVQLLLANGADTVVRDLQGRTVLEVLRAHQANTASELTQLMQHRHKWTQCIAIIEEFDRTGHVEVGDYACDKSLSPTSTCDSLPRSLHSDISTYMNTPPRHINKAAGGNATYGNVPAIGHKVNGIENGNTIWQNIPPKAAEKLARKQHENSPLAILGRLKQTDTLTPVQALQALSLNVDNESENGLCSNNNVNLNSGPPSTLTVSSDWVSGNQTHSVHMPLPSSVSPSHSARSQSSTRTISPSKALSVLMTNQERASPNSTNHHSATVTHCSYAPPAAANYDAWTPKQSGYDNLDDPRKIVHPHLAYDNVPSNLLVYDNAPPPGHKRWQHACDEHEHAQTEGHQAIAGNQSVDTNEVSGTKDCTLGVLSDRNIRTTNKNGTALMKESDVQKVSDLPVKPPRHTKRVHIVTIATECTQPQAEWLSCSPAASTVCSTSVLEQDKEEGSPCAPLATPEEMSESLCSNQHHQMQTNSDSASCTQSMTLLPNTLSVSVHMHDSLGHTNELMAPSPINNVDESSRDTAIIEDLSTASGDNTTGGDTLPDSERELSPHIDEEWKQIEHIMSSCGESMSNSVVVCSPNHTTPSTTSKQQANQVAVQLLRDMHLLHKQAADAVHIPDERSAHASVAALAEWKNEQKSVPETIQKESTPQSDGSPDCESVAGAEMEAALCSGQVFVFCCHRLGCCPLQPADVNRPELRHEQVLRAMHKLKNAEHDLSQVQQVLLEISHQGIRQVNANTKHELAYHPVECVGRVEQDARDLNVFAFVARQSDTQMDTPQSYAHVFAVLTAQQATELITCLGRAFAVAYKLRQLDTELDLEGLDADDDSLGEVAQKVDVSEENDTLV